MTQVVGEPHYKPKWQNEIHENGARDLCFGGHITPSSVLNPAWAARAAQSPSVARSQCYCRL